MSPGGSFLFHVFEVPGEDSDSNILGGIKLTGLPFFFLSCPFESRSEINRTQKPNIKYIEPTLECESPGGPR
jgi:hypothetical protein